MDESWKDVSHIFGYIDPNDVGSLDSRIIDDQLISDSDSEDARLDNQYSKESGSVMTDPLDLYNDSTAESPNAISNDENYFDQPQISGLEIQVSRGSQDETICHGMPEHAYNDGIQASRRGGPQSRKRKNPFSTSQQQRLNPRRSSHPIVIEDESDSDRDRFGRSQEHE